MTATLDDEVAELRRANAELQQRLDEALTREVATAEVMAVINSSPGDLTPVFEALLETGARLCRAEQGFGDGKFCVEIVADLRHEQRAFGSPPRALTRDSAGSRKVP